VVSPDRCIGQAADCERIRTSKPSPEQVMERVIGSCPGWSPVVRLHDGDPCLYGRSWPSKIAGLGDAAWTWKVGCLSECPIGTAAALQARTHHLRSGTDHTWLSRASGRTGVPARESLERSRPCAPRSAS